MIDPLRTHPVHWLDTYLWPILRELWEPISGKQSHWWQRVKGYPVAQMPNLKIKGKKSIGRRTNFLSNFLLSNFVWKEVLVLQPYQKNGEPYYGKFQIAWASPDEGFSELCTVILQYNVAVLQSADDTLYAAVELNGNPLLLKEVNRTSKQEIKGSSIPII